MEACVILKGRPHPISKGIIDDALETYGADAIRWYFYTASAPWIPKRFSGKLVQEGHHVFLQ